MAEGLEAFGIFLATVGGSGFLGFLAGYALKKIAKIVAIVLGVFFMALMYLHYSKMLTVNWDIVSDRLYEGATIALNKTTEVVNTISQETQGDNGLTIGVSVATFAMGFVLGLSRG